MSIKIHGKDYVTVNERIADFRKTYKDWTLDSSIVFQDEKTILIKAIILDKNGTLIASGHAHEDKTSSTINKTSHVENCETSAWGRALANFGIGVEVSIASADEVVIALSKQNEQKKWEPEPEKTVKIMATLKQRDAVITEALKKGKDMKEVQEYVKEKYKVLTFTKLTQDQSMEVMAYYESLPEVN